ncbi:MAG: transposase [Lachnospiraceae bacterium]|nr:transposase [Lachnospiraceae bacterium]
MTKKKQDLKPDTVLKMYWSDNAQFADLFNAVLFDGEQVILPEELEDVDTEESTVMEHKEYAESIIASRDNIKIQKKSTVHGVQFVLLGLESQEHIHYAMPMRVMGYDYGSYKKQYDSNAKKYRNAEGLEEDEFLSRMKKTDKFVPVITVVVYYGEKPWDGAESLHEMLNIAEKMKPFVNNYKMLLVEARENDLKLHNINNQDFFNLMEILLDRNRPMNETKNRAIDYAREHEVTKSVVMTVAGAANCKMDYNAFEKGDGGMCTVFETIAKEGELKGRLEGKLEGRAVEIVETGYEFGLSEPDILKRLQQKLEISLQKAQEFLNMYGKQTL